MKRVGILDVDELTEKLVRGIFLAVPEAQVFLVSGNNERARRLERALPCWTLDHYQDVVDEADVIITGVDCHAMNEIANQVQLRSSQTLVSLVPGVNSQRLRDLFGHADCVRLMLTFAAEINQSNVILTAADKEVQDLFSRLGQLTVLPDESDFDLATVSLCMNGWFYFFAEGLQCWLAEKGMADEVARRLVLGGLRDCAEYANHNAAIALSDLGNGIPEHLTLQGLEVLAKMQALNPWRAASETVLSIMQKTTQPQ
ncbi:MULTISPECIES: NAD(P)-binding domain-containing protein [unclassified Serratia (in: enterobacteria)]|uniref:NAD(P)-binding domain-containing protein n=1 Tax=unclassified Serratia (in: enterobacteria) TaxID=2647522 RepID=UPI002ED16E7C|nr:NAD(P)-binding domain-containing protein [Serratia sp. C2(2)]MEE4445671.1 NAD(P)-binding domain-containing protein [Serratia sp. C2(1)]